MPSFFCSFFHCRYAVFRYLSPTHKAFFTSSIVRIHTLICVGAASVPRYPSVRLSYGFLTLITRTLLFLLSTRCLDRKVGANCDGISTRPSLFPRSVFRHLCHTQREELNGLIVCRKVFFYILCCCIVVCCSHRRTCPKMSIHAETNIRQTPRSTCRPLPVFSADPCTQRLHPSTTTSLHIKRRLKELDTAVPELV